VIHCAASDGIRIDHLSEIFIELHASDPATNRRRAWRVVAGADLFGRWTAHVSFGRIGAAGRTIRHEFESETAAVAFVRRSLRRRATADRLLVLTGLRCPAR
jgi:predicted DNA-binding WGR domain protein